MAYPRWHAVTLHPDHFQGEGEGELGVGRGANVRLWGRVGGGVSGSNELQAVLSMGPNSVSKVNFSN